MSSPAPFDNGRCFACGPYNAIGLHMRFEREGESGVRADVMLGEEFQGWEGAAHGGIVAALLDEAMAHAAGMLGHRGVTAGLDMRFRKPVPLGAPLTVRGRVLWVRRNVLSTQAEVAAPDGTVLASGEGRFVSRGAVEPGKLGAGAFE